MQEGAMQDREHYLPYLRRVDGNNVWIHVPKHGLSLQEAIEFSAPWAQEHCDMYEIEVGTYLVAADTAIMNRSMYDVTWRCCSPDDECCHKPKSKACE